jgi:predicted acylesterase/phospholipase RssA
VSDQIGDAVARIAGFADLSAAAERQLTDALKPRTLRAGEVLFEAGAPADGMVAIERGRLGVIGNDDEIVATLGRGELVGEMGALTGEARSSTVVALRDTAVLEIDQVAFDQLFESSPSIGRALSRLVIHRLVGEPEPDHRRAIPRVVALVTMGRPDDGDLLVDSFTTRVGSATVVTADIAVDRSHAELLETLDSIEADNDLVVLLGGELRAGVAPDAEEWSDLCVRQADVVVVVVDPQRVAAGELAALGRRLSTLTSTVELAMMNRAHAEVGVDALPWVAALGPDRLHHLRAEDRRSFDRCARLVLGQGVGLVFSGGAAKGLAHLGAWQALCELGVEIDAVAGVSFGALLAAGVALDYTPEALRSEVRERLVEERGLVDLTFPWMALLRGEGVSHRLADVARGRRFEQTWRGFVCTSCDLVTGELVEHRAGPLWEAIRASVSIPGVLPPVRIGDRLLVDGAVRSNLPIGPLRAGHPTPMTVIAIDVGKDGALPAGETPGGGGVSGWKLVARRLDPRRSKPSVPSMSQVLMRVMELAGDDGDAVADRVIRPDLSRLGVGDFAEIDSFAKAGYDATIDALG